MIDVLVLEIKKQWQKRGFQAVAGSMFALSPLCCKPTQAQIESGLLNRTHNMQLWGPGGLKWWADRLL